MTEIIPSGRDTAPQVGDYEHLIATIWETDPKIAHGIEVISDLEGVMIIPDNTSTKDTTHQ